MTDRGGPPADPTKAQTDLIDALARIAKGSPESLVFLYEATSTKLYWACLRILNDRSEAEDILQLVYLSVWQNAAAFDPAKGSAMAWLTAIARHKSIDRVRSLNSTAGTARSSDETEVVDTAPLADIELEHTEQQQQVSDALAGLNPKHANAILQIYQAGLTYDEAALRLNVPVSTVKSWVRRGLAKLRKSFDR